jgi:hypothetical protein
MNSDPKSIFKKSTTLIFVVAALQIIKIVVLRDHLTDIEIIALNFIPLILFVGIGFLIRQEFGWTKYILLV